MWIRCPLKLKRYQALYMTTNLRHGYFSVSALCGGDDDDEEGDDDDVSAACLHFKSRPSADLRLICFNEAIIGLISIHLVQRPADTKHEERLHNTPPPRSTTARIPPCGGAAAPSAASTVSSIKFGGSGLR